MSIEHFLLYRRRYEVAFALGVGVLVGVTHATSRIMENVRDQLPEPAWVAWLMEGSSVLSLWLLLPFIIWFHSRLALTRQTVLWRVLWHVPAAVVFCLGHVALFSLFRYWGMPLGGLRYSIDDPLWFELLYEFRKDVITYSFIVLGLTYSPHRDHWHSRVRLSLQSTLAIVPKPASVFLILIIDLRILTTSVSLRNGPCRSRSSIFRLQ